MLNNSSYPTRKVLQVAEDVAAISGGVPAVVKQLSERLSSSFEVSVFSAAGDLSTFDPAVNLKIVAPSHLGRPWRWSSDMRRVLDESIRDKSLVHIHGVWSAPQFIAAKISKEKNVASIFSAHGMLEPWLWDSQGWKTRLKKRAYWRLVREYFLSTNVVHAITHIERENLRELFPRNAIEIIPNAIEIPSLPGIQKEREKYILFLGRIEQKKGVDILLNAFAKSRLSSEWKLKIAGPVWSSLYLEQLKNIVVQNQLQSRVEFIGPVFGNDKQSLLERAWVMATPSHSEAIGLVNLEAARFLCPTITTHQTGLADWEEGGGLLIQPDADELSLGLNSACSWTTQEQSARGLASFELVQRRYSWRAILPRWKDLYSAL